MQFVDLKVGLRFKTDDQIYRITKLLPNSFIEAQNEKFPGTIQLSRTEIINRLTAKTLVFEVTSKNYSPDKDNFRSKSDFADLSTQVNPEHYQIALFRFKVIEPLIRLENKTLAIKERVTEINSIINDPTKAIEKLGMPVLKKISVASVYRWLHLYAQSNHDKTALIPSYHRSGGKNIFRISNTVRLRVKLS